MFINSLLNAEEATQETTHLIQDASETVEKASRFVENSKDFIPSIISFGLNLLIALLIFCIGKLLIRILLKVCKRFLDRTKIEITVSKFLLSLIRAIAYVILVLVMLETVGIKTTSFLAVLTTASFALGLALQGSLSNFAGGILILILKPFKVGDYICTGGLEGTVSKIDLFYTTLITLDNKLNSIPNGTLSNASLTNVTAFDTRRVDFEFGISYNSDISKAKDILIRCASEHNMVMKEKEIFAFVSNLAASQVTLGLRVWVNSSDYWTVKFDLAETIKIRLEKEGIEIPFNQIVVHEADN